LDLSHFKSNYCNEIYYCSSYSLNNETDQNELNNCDIDILFVIGWQRLIPEWFLKKLSIGAFGMHGSSRALPYGRGRSPMNWSLIQNKEFFITNLFKYTPGIDDGDIVATNIFDITIFDDAKTMHYKNTLSMIKLIEEHFEKLTANTFRLHKQREIEPTYYPKRTPDDGIIFWETDTIEIYNLVRAVTKPFYGAFTFLNKERVIIWSAKPFDSRLFNTYEQPGKILHHFANGDFIVKTGNGSLLVEEYEANNGVISKGKLFNSLDFKYKNPFNYPE
jgi:methionyl-tRNA formyltransferase